MEQKIKYTTLPTGKILHNIYDIKSITNINSNQDKYEITSNISKKWYEFEIEYGDSKRVSPTYKTINSANLDRDFIIETINYKI